MILFIIPPHNSYLNIIQLSIYSTFYFLQYVTVEGKEHSLPTGKLIVFQQLTGLIIFPLAWILQEKFIEADYFIHR